MGNHFAKIKEKPVTSVAYICDGKDCADQLWPSCKITGTKIDHCDHTTNPEHAKNGPCEDPENHPERFKELQSGRYWEIEQG